MTYWKLLIVEHGWDLHLSPLPGEVDLHDPIALFPRCLAQLPVWFSDNCNSFLRRKESSFNCFKISNALEKCDTIYREIYCSCINFLSHITTKIHVVLMFKMFKRP